VAANVKELRWPLLWVVAGEACGGGPTTNGVFVGRAVLDSERKAAVVEGVEGEEEAVEVEAPKIPYIMPSSLADEGRGAAAAAAAGGGGRRRRPPLTAPPALLLRRPRGEGKERGLLVPPSFMAVPPHSSGSGTNRR